MGTLDVWGAIAASFLLVQCLIFNLVFVILSLVLWKGSEWVRKKTALGLTKLNQGALTASDYSLKGQSRLVTSFIRLRGRVAGARSIIKQLKG